MSTWRSWDCSGEPGGRKEVWDEGAQSSIQQVYVTAPRLGAGPGPYGAPRSFWAEHRAIKGGAEEPHDLMLLAILEFKRKQSRQEPECQWEAVPAFQVQIYSQDDSVSSEKGWYMVRPWEPGLEFAPVAPLNYNGDSQWSPAKCLREAASRFG